MTERSELIARLICERNEARELAVAWRAKREFGIAYERMPWEPAETYQCPGCHAHLGLFGPTFCPLCGAIKPVIKDMVRP